MNSRYIRRTVLPTTSGVGLLLSVGARKRIMLVTAAIAVMAIGMAPSAHAEQLPQSEGCSYLNRSERDGVYYATGTDGPKWFFAGEQITLVAGPPTPFSDPSTMTLSPAFGSTPLVSAPFPGTINYTIPASGSSSFVWQTDGNATWSVGCSAAADSDADGIPDATDSCPDVANPSQANNDGDAQGDACDGDIDGDGVLNGSDAFPLDPTEQQDTDGDGLGDHADVLPVDPVEQHDSDGDNAGNNTDNCPTASNSDQADHDGDMIGDACDALTFIFTGFAAPIDEGLANTAKAGQAIPVKYHLATLDGMPVSDASSFVSITSQSDGGVCAGLSSDAIETYAGGSGLLYLGEGNWQLIWKTPKTYAGQCRTMTLTLADGSMHTAYFEFK